MRPAHTAVSGLAVPGTQIGGCGFCSGRAPRVDVAEVVVRPSHRNGPGVVQHLMIRSWHSSKRSRL